MIKPFLMCHGYIFYLTMQYVCCETWFELHLIKFDNPSGREEDGDCCDVPCSNQCDPDITICFDKPHTAECSLSKRKTGHYHENSFHFGPKFENGDPNPITVKIGESWVNTLMITVKVDDRDGLTANEPMGKIRKAFTRAPSVNQQNATWNKIDFVFTYQTIFAQARVYCDTNWYGEDCMTYCVSQSSDKFGHYTCAVNGSKVCRENYHGSDCKNFCEPSDNDLGHYFCDENGTPLCLDGWSGGNCTVDINECYNTSNNPCWPNGLCINSNGSYDCNCSEHYTGLNCQDQVLHCEDSPCSNHSLCNNTLGGFICVCDPGWTGSLCEYRMTPCTSDPCKHDGLCTVIQGTFQCQCVGQWEGRTCEQEMVILLNDTKVFYFKGHLDEDKWDTFNLGIRHLLKDILHISDVTIETIITYPSKKQTKVEVFVESKDPKVYGSLSKILFLPEEEVVTSLVLPLSEKQEMIGEPSPLKPDPWVKKHWYVVLVVVLVLMVVLTIFVVATYVIKKHRRGDALSLGVSRSSQGRDSITDAAVGFDNSLYFEPSQPEKLRGLPEIPKTACNGTDNLA